MLLCRLLRLPSRLRRRARRSRMTALFTLFGVGVLLLAPFYCVYKPPALLIRYFQYRWPDVLWQVTTSRRLIALSIDDVPSALTAEILDILRDNDATATFFVIGSQVQTPEAQELLARAVREGHELGNHAMHDEPSRALSAVELGSQIKEVEHIVKLAYTASGTGKEPPRFFRPGSGFFNARMRHQISELGYRLVLGGIYPHDPQIHSWRINARHILSMLRPGGIIICHDRRPWTSAMLRRVLPAAHRRGYQVVSISHLLDA